MYDIVVVTTERSSKMIDSRSPRVARRRRRMRDALLVAGAKQFATRGIAQVSVEDLLAEADISRSTFYDIFSSKNKLLENIINPIFDMAILSILNLREV